MISRYAIFEGTIKEGKTEAFRAAVLEKLVPIWKTFPGGTALRVTFGDERDEGAPEYPLIMSVDYPDMAAVEVALASQTRLDGRVATLAMLPEFFDGKITHHVTTKHAYDM